MKDNPVWDWDRGKRVHAMFCRLGKCTIPLERHPYPEWWVYAGYYIETGDNTNIFVRFREQDGYGW